MERRKPANTNANPFIKTEEELESAIQSTRTEFKDENGFDRMNSNFYITEDEEGEIVFLNDGTQKPGMPYVASVHVLHMKSKKGKSFYPTEICQKNFQKSCVMCDASKSNESVSKQKEAFFYQVLDLRGKRSEKDSSKFEGDPVPMLWQTHKAVAAQIVKHKKDLGNDLTDIIFKVNRVGKETHVTIKQERDPKTRSVVDCVYEGDYPELLPNFNTIWGNMLPDEELIKKLDYTA